MISPRTLRNLRKELRQSALAKVGIAIVVFMILMAMFAPLVAPYSPGKQHLNDAREPPIGFTTKETKEVTKTENGSVVIENGSVVTENRTVYNNATWTHPLGTDGNGRDILSRVIYGARTSMLVGLFGTALAALIGVTVGLTAGFYRGTVDDALMRAADVMLAFPSLVLAIALVGVWGQAVVRIPDPLVVFGVADWWRSLVGLSGAQMPRNVVLPGTVILVVALVNWVWFARVSRGEALSVREEEYVKAARALGAGKARTIGRHVLPNSVTPILVLATTQVAAIILLESSLSFLGFSGADVSWGFDIALGRQYQSTSWWISAIPGLAIVVTVIGLNLVGDWLRDALDPGIEGEGGV